MNIDEEARVKHRLQCRIVELEAVLRNCIDEWDDESYPGASTEAFDRARKILQEKVLCPKCGYTSESKVHQSRCGLPEED